MRTMCGEAACVWCRWVRKLTAGIETQLSGQPMDKPSSPVVDKMPRMMILTLLLYYKELSCCVTEIYQTVWLST
jgi:hypothetical protein